MSHDQAPDEPLPADIHTSRNPAPAQHTPGPWTAQINQCHHAVLSLDGSDIALVRASDFDSEANARLIAGAPELLAALEPLAREVGKYIDHCRAMNPAVRHSGQGKELIAIHEAARAAIAKAKGGAA